MEYRMKIRDFIQRNLMVSDDITVIKDEDNIFEMGVVNSLFAMKLLDFVEHEFAITVETEDMDIRNFSSIENIEQLVLAKNR